MRYLYVDYGRVQAEGFLACLADSVRRFEAEPLGALMLIEVTQIPKSTEFLTAVKRANHDVFGPRRTRKVYLGADDLHRSIIHGLTLVAPSVQGLVFSDRATALAALRAAHGTHRSAADATWPDIGASPTGPADAEDLQGSCSDTPRRPHQCPNPRTR